MQDLNITSGFGNGVKYLKKYQYSYGISEISLNYKSSDGFCLGAWVFYQKNRLKIKANKNSLDKKVQQVIDSITSKVTYTEWDIGVYFLKDHLKKYPLTTIQYKFKTMEGFPLGVWLANNKKHATNNTLLSSQKRILAELGLLDENEGAKVSSTSYEQGLIEFRTNYDKLRHKLITKDTVSSSYYPVGYWLYERLVEMRSGRLGAIKFRQMLASNCLPYMTLEKFYWLEGINSLFDVLSKNKGDIPFDYIDSNGFYLGDWLCYVREIFQRGLLPLDRKVILDDLGYDIALMRKSDWEIGYPYLMEFLTWGNGAPIKNDTKTKDGYPVGRWLNSVLRRLVNDHLSVDKAIKLKSAGVCFGHKDVVSWLKTLSPNEQLYHSLDAKLPTLASDIKCGVLVRPDKSAPLNKCTNSGAYSLKRCNWVLGLENLSLYLEGSDTNITSLNRRLIGDDSYLELREWVKSIQGQIGNGSAGFVRAWVLSSFGLAGDKNKPTVQPDAGENLKLSDWLKARKKQTIRIY